MSVQLTKNFIVKIKRNVFISNMKGYLNYILKLLHLYIKMCFIDYLYKRKFKSRNETNISNNMKGKLVFKMSYQAKKLIFLFHLIKKLYYFYNNLGFVFMDTTLEIRSYMVSSMINNVNVLLLVTLITITYLCNSNNNYSFVYLYFYIYNIYIFILLSLFRK